jgi:hypothetical protein
MLGLPTITGDPLDSGHVPFVSCTNTPGTSSSDAIDLCRRVWCSPRGQAAKVCDNQERRQSKRYRRPAFSHFSPLEDLLPRGRVAARPDCTH